MSRAGKFIPGGGGNKGKRTGPIRAPDPSAPGGDPSNPSAPLVKKTFGKGLVKPVGKNQRVPIVIMSAIVCCMLVSVGWYTMAYLPAQREITEYKRQIAQNLADQAAQQAAEEKKTPGRSRKRSG